MMINLPIKNGGFPMATLNNHRVHITYVIKTIVGLKRDPQIK